MQFNESAFAAAEPAFVALVAGGPKSGKSGLLQVAARSPQAEVLDDGIALRVEDSPIVLLEADPEEATDARPDAIVFTIRGEEYPEVALGPVVRRMRAAADAGLPAVLVVCWRGNVLSRLDPGRCRLRAVLEREVPDWRGPIVDAARRPGGADRALEALAALAREAVPA